MYLRIFRKYVLNLWWGFTELIATALANYGFILDQINKANPNLATQIAEITNQPTINLILSPFTGHWVFWVFFITCGFYIYGLIKETRPYLGQEIRTRNIVLQVGRPEETDEEIYVWLRVINNEQEDLSDCFATLNKVYMVTEAIWLDWELQANPNLSKLTWPNFSKPRNVIIRGAGKEERLNIAKYSKASQGISFILEHGDKSISYSDQGFFIEIGLNGRIRGKKIKEIKICGYLKRDLVRFETGEQRITTHNIEKGDTISNTQITPSRLNTEINFYFQPADCGVIDFAEIYSIDGNEKKSN